MIDRALAGLFKVVSEEAATNPGFAKRMEDSLGKFAEDYVEARRAEHRLGDFHPFIAFGKLGAEAFRAQLGKFDAMELRLIVDKHNLDPAQVLKAKASKKALVEHVFAVAEKRAARDAKLFEY